MMDEILNFIKQNVGVVYTQNWELQSLFKKRSGSLRGQLVIMMVSMVTVIIAMGCTV